MRPFEKIEEEAIPFYETGWFAMAVRNGVAILGVLLVLLLAVRPAIKALKARSEGINSDGEDDETVLVKGPDGTYAPAPNPGVDREAGVLGLAIWMLSSAASARKRSSRALECSGPIPSKP